MADDNGQQFFRAEHLVEAQSAHLRKELRLGDLVFSQLAYMVGLSWMGTAGKLGSAHIMYWIPAVLLFYVPSGMVVVHLNREMPLEGGLYQWAKLRFGELTGFLVALNLWASLMLILGSGVSQLTDNVAYAIGPRGSWIVENKAITVLIGVLLMSILILLAVRGLSVAKWLHNAGGFVLLVALTGMVALALPRWISGVWAVAPVGIAFPALSMMNLNVLGKMSFGAFCGFDGMTIFSGELRDPNVARTIRRSIWLAGPLIALFYIAGTACVLTFSSPDQIDLISPTTQVVALGAKATRFAVLAIPVAAVLMIANLIGGSSIFFNALIRLPMVAGWDHLLPRWLSRLHPRFRTPIGSIVFVGVSVVVLTILGNLGTGAQESFQLLNNAGIICWALTYLVLFSIPLVGRGEKPSGAVRVAAVCGFGMTLLYVIFAAFPIVDVKSPASFALKMSGMVLGLNLAGFWYFRRATRRRRASAVAQAA